MHQVRQLKFLNKAASDLFLRPKLMMIFYLPQTVSLLPIFAINYCVPGRCQLSAWLSDLRDVCDIYQVRQLELLNMAASDLFLRPKLTMIFHLPRTSSHPNLVVFAHALREEAKSVSQHLEDVRKGREKAPTYSTSFIEIPKEFHSFKWPPVASKKHKAAKK